jgi:protein TonB
MHLWNVAVVSSQLKLKAMTSKEILGSSFLEILFQHRNKEYGAYPLRKYYNNRLGVALGIAISFAFLILFFAMQITGSEAAGPSIFDEEGGVIINTVNMPDPTPPKPPIQPRVQRQRSIDYNHIEIVKDLKRTNVPTLEQLATGGQIASTSHDGPDEPHLPPSTGTAAPTIIPIETEIEKPALITSAPEFPGGQQAWLLFLTKHLRTPDELEGGERRTVRVKFVVSVDGTITDFTVVQSGGAALDNEVIRVLKKMPRWKPAVQNGQVVTTAFTQPVIFQAVEE